MLKKKHIVLRHPPYRDTSQSSNSKDRITSLWVYMDEFKPKVQVEAAVNACSAAPLTAMMNCVPKCVCVCVVLWNEIAASAGRDMTKWECS